MTLLNSLFHIHTYKENQIDDKGYQYCTSCGKAAFIGVLYKEYTWEIQERIQFTDKNDKIYKITFVQKCRETGELRSFSIKS